MRLGSCLMERALNPPIGPDDTLVLGHDDPAAVLSDVSLGRVSAGSVLEKKLVARLAGLVGERRMELVVSCKATDEASGLAPMEHISLVALPVNAPFLLDFDTTYVHRKSPKKTLLSFDERDPWADAALATFSASVQSQESTPLWLESLSLELEVRLLPELRSPASLTTCLRILNTKFV